MADSVQKKHWLGLPASVWILGLVTFLKNTSSVALVIFCPLYLSEVLCVGMADLGLLEGFVEGFSFFSRIASGSLSDAMRKRKPVLLLGYCFSLLGRLFLALSSSVTGLVVSRSCERLGNGLQASPRDALVADYSSPKNRGACFGLRHSLTVSGSVIGAALAMWYMSATNNNYRGLFWLTLIPSTLSILLLIFFVQDVKAKSKNQASKWRLSDINRLPVAFWKLTLLSTTVMLGNFGIVFLIMASKNLGLPSHQSPIVMVVQSLSTAFLAYPLGQLSDKIGKKRMLPLGLICLALGNFGMAYATNLWWVFVCIIFWGAQLGIIYNTTLSYITDVTPESLRGTGIGTIHFCNGLGTLCANFITGFLWETFSSQVAFSFTGCLALLSLTLLPFMLPKESLAD